MKPFLWLVLLVAGLQMAHATHLRGGYIRTQSASTNALTQQITLVLYMDELYGRAAADVSTEQEICFGDGSSLLVPRQARQYLANRTISVNTYQVMHTYAGPGVYTLTVGVVNRTGVQNIPSADQIAFALTTTLSISNSGNQTPVFAYSGDTLTVNQRATVNLRATDSDGDSLVYGLARPLNKAMIEPCTSVTAVSSFQFPNDLTRQGTFKLNSATGVLIWDVPTQQGNFSVALTVSEYRRGTLISQTQEEIILMVIDRPGSPTPLPAYEPAVLGTNLVTALPEYRDEDVLFSAFPNPVDDRLQVTIQSTRTLPATVQLLDMNGRLIHQSTFTKAARQHEQVISTENLSAGTYLLRAKVGQRTLTQKVLKR
ncbi:T9SS type A sorting domain-containing protein [Spirosoma sp. KUDC1026]|uniref:T9SS type A sorting domain-containing protein n=1 Tax=Spirosoma sp. KUDC1026 TaxID=2745947 RepID=UPI00159BDA9B|nr:T9SS type A sorting domain-containing protein [Spirosoma sp. KUDC1026]QKZ11337.1 T9SS type A sorting domain-containing protein [Spirosoma sp. KUDC1026]